MSKLELYLSKIVKYGLYAVLLTPLAFWPRALYGFMTPKFVLFQILVEIVFGAWILLAILNREYRPKFSWLITALLLFVIVSVISALFGVDFQRSLWGIGARMTGLFAELHFLAWFLVLVSISKSGVDIKKYLNFSFAVCIVVALSAFFQNPEWRLVFGSTFFNNPTFAAPYFLFHFFWGLYQIWNSKSWQKLYYISASALILWAIFLGQIRGAFVGLFLGILFLGGSLIFSDIFKIRFRITIAVLYAILILSLILGWQFRDSKFIEQSYFGRFSKISFEDTTTQTRLLIWQSALKGFSLLGVGPENFSYLFNANYNPRLLMYSGSSFAETWQDKPHNALIEVLTETGIIGGLAYAIIWAAVSLVLYKLFRRGEKFLSLILASAFIAYFSTVFFSFDSFGSWFGLFLFLAFLASQNRDANIRIHANYTNKKILPVLVSLVFICILASVYGNYSIWCANLADADALRIFGQNTGEGVTLFKKSLSYFTPYKAEYQFDLIASVIGAMQKNVPLPDIENTINFALDEANKALNAHPENAAYYSDMAKLYGILGGMGRDSAILAQSEEFGKKALELSPKRQETMFYLAQTALLRGDTKLAIEWTKQAVQVDPAIKQSHWYLGRLYIASGKNEEGISEIKKALELGYRPQNQNEKDFIQNFGL